jgi:GT2 family glycosyltransferase
MISVVILTYKRRDELLRVLASVQQQDYANREIILVDNASNDGLQEFVRVHAPEVKLIQLPQNLGACGGRNAGIEKARGEILITLDNDIYLDSPLELSKIATVFKNHPEIHVLAFQLCDSETGKLRLREWCHPRPWKEFSETEFETNFFVEGACAYRREIFEVSGLYYEPIFIGCEGHDLALRILDHGFRILYCPHIRARHLLSPATRTKDRPFYYYTRNYIWIAYKDYHFVDGLQFIVPKLLMMLYFSLRARRFGAFQRGLRDGVKGLRQIHPNRTPISNSTARYFAELEQWRPDWMTRLGRHKLEPQI